MTVQQQRTLALKKANTIRAHKARMKIDISNLPAEEAVGVVADVLENPDFEPACMGLEELLLSVSGLGRTKVRRLKLAAGVYHAARVGELSARQRGVLAGLVRGQSWRG